LYDIHNKYILQHYIDRQKLQN